MIGLIARLIPVLLIIGGLCLLGFGAWRVYLGFVRTPGRSKWIPIGYLGIVILIILFAILNQH